MPWRPGTSTSTMRDWAVGLAPHVERIVPGDIHDIEATRPRRGIGGRGKAYEAEGGKGEFLHGILRIGSLNLPEPT